MAISKTENYLVLNHSASPVAVSTKYESFMIDGGSADAPGSLPLSFDEIAVVNSKSPVFKIGILRFEPEYEKELYEALSIPNWQEIMTDAQIEDALINPTKEMSQKILNIQNDAYFERVRGIMVGLRNAGVDITIKMERMIEQRREEFARRQRKTSIRLVDNNAKEALPSQEEFDAMKEQLVAMQAMMERMMASNKANGADHSEVSVTKETKKKSAAK